MSTYKCTQCGLVNWVTSNFCNRCQLPNHQFQTSPSQGGFQHVSAPNAVPVSFPVAETAFSNEFNNPAFSGARRQPDFGAPHTGYNYPCPQNPHVQINITCGMCGFQSNSMKKLYEDDVCSICHRQYISRRQLAFLLDLVIYRGAATLLLVWLGLLISESMGVLGFGLSFLPLLLRDGTSSGASLGKMALGLKTYDFTTKQPCGMGKSIARNVILYVPFMLIIELVFIQSGKRLGDRMCNTRVVWNKYAGARVFWK